MTLANRFAQALHKSGLTQKALAELIGLSQQAINKIVDGTTKHPRKMEAIATALNTSPEWLLYGKHSAKMDGLAYNVESAADPKGLLPEIGWIAAGHFANTPSYDPFDDMVATHPRPANAGANAYALRVRGISNENLGARLTYSDGDIIFMSRERAPQHGSMVAVYCADRHETIFKQLVIENGTQYLRALNPAWPEQIISIKENMHIVGVAIGRYIPS
jgi:SOS-response transcriptional repressor LexA